ncbi:MAG TPA: hypothetical protein VN629_01985, partial [Castellaniella sp.]|nr:hypothetical protein [Castellaniella sp.]
MKGRVATGHRSLANRHPVGGPVRWLIVVAIASGLSGCALSERLRQAAARHQEATQDVARSHQQFSGAITDAEQRRAAQRVDKPWIAGRAQPLARELSLPPALRADVHTTLLFADGTDDLRKIARRIATVTGIPVRVRPDALLPDSHFLPRLA